MSAKLEMLSQRLHAHLGELIQSSNPALGELRIDVAVADYYPVM